MNIDEWEILAIAQPYSKDEKVPHGWYRYYRTVDEAEFRFFMRLNSDNKIVYELNIAHDGLHYEIIWQREQLGPPVSEAKWPEWDERLAPEEIHEFFMSLIAAHPGSKDYTILIEWARRVKEIRGQISEFI